MRFENDQRDVQPDLVAALGRAFEMAGVRFIEAGGNAGGVIPPPLEVPPPK